MNEGRTEGTEASLAISKPILSPHFIHIKRIFPHKYSKRRSKTVCRTISTNHTTANKIDVNRENQSKSKIARDCGFDFLLILNINQLIAIDFC